MQARYYVDPDSGIASLWANPPEGFVPEEEWTRTHPQTVQVPEADLASAEAGSIRARLKELDGESIRALRAIAEGAETDEDREKLAAICEEAEGLRVRLRELEAGA